MANLSVALLDFRRVNAANEDDLYAEFDRWEAASDEGEVQIEAMLATKGM